MQRKFVTLVLTLSAALFAGSGNSLDCMARIRARFSLAGWLFRNWYLGDR